jgi:hypothetical protein
MKPRSTFDICVMLYQRGDYACRLHTRRLQRRIHFYEVTEGSESDVQNQHWYNGLLFVELLRR